MKKVAFYISHGVEVRYFLLSGLADHLRGKGVEIIFLLKPEINSPVLNDYLKQFNVNALFLNLSHSAITVASGESYIRSLRNAYKRHQNIPIYGHFGGNIGRPKIYDAFLGNRWGYYFIDYFSRIYLRWHYKNSELRDFLALHHFTDLFFLEYSDVWIKALGINADMMGINSHVSVNTLKTVFINDFIPFSPKHFFSWNNIQNELYRNANPNISPSVFGSAGSLYHHFLRTKEYDKVYQDILEKYDLNHSRKIILYSLIFEKVYPKEHNILEQISQILEDEFDEKDRPLIIVRRNPFEESCSHVDYIRQLKNVVIADHYWERDVSKGWSIQAYQGELEWKCLIQIACLNMNIPSMSTIDALVCGTPVINIGFNDEGHPNTEISHIINAPFVEEFDKSAFVFTVKEVITLQENIYKWVKIKEEINKDDITHSIDIALPELKSFLSE